MWRARDKDGKVWYYECCPFLYYRKNVWVNLYGRVVFGIGTDVSDKWDESLEDSLVDDSFNEDWYDGLL